MHGQVSHVKIPVFIFEHRHFPARIRIVSIITLRSREGEKYLQCVREIFESFRLLLLIQEIVGVLHVDLHVGNVNSVLRVRTLSDSKSISDKQPMK